MTMTRPCRRMIRHLLQIFFTLGLTFIRVSLAGRAPARRVRSCLSRSGCLPRGAACPLVRYLYL
jgi:hypothetical protein